MSDPKRLIEVAFPLKQTSLDSVHEKNVRHGHISTLHIWPARRPLAACRAALIATLLPDPGDPQERKELLERLGGKLVKKVKRKKTDTGWVEEATEETEGGILHWGRESGPDLEYFRQKIRETYGGRAPKVLDPFAGGGAIPLEAMRMGCEATAVDINPVAWFILKCTLEYPQKLAGKTRPLPDFTLQDREFMESFLKSKGFKGKALEAQLELLGFGPALNRHLPGMEASGINTEANLAWHVRAWGRWVLHQARKDLARFYPTYADFEPLAEVTGKLERRPMKLVPLKGDGTSDIDALNAEFPQAYLADRRNPRWVAKPTVAYLWARTVTCKNCRTTLPLLKTRWLCKKDKKRVALTMEPNAEKTEVFFGVWKDVPVVGKNTAEKKAHDAKVGGGTMSRSGATCPCCGAIMTTEDIRLEGQAGQLRQVMTVVVVDGQTGKEYRIPTQEEVLCLQDVDMELGKAYASIPFDKPSEMIPLGGSRAGGGSPFTVPRYGMDAWNKLFLSRQLLTLSVFIEKVISIRNGSPLQDEWEQAINAFLGILIDKLADRNSTQCIWISTNAEKASGSFGRFALPITWDFVEIMPWSESAGGYLGNLEHVGEFLDHALTAATASPSRAICQSATQVQEGVYDLVLTDPPYYDAIPYSDLMDFFYVWLKRTVSGVTPEFSAAFSQRQAPKWDHEKNDGELIDDASRFEGDLEKSKKNYEDGMFRAFQACEKALSQDGRLIIVFAHKLPNAWETLVSAIIRSGFVVDGSWPIQTERSGRLRSQTSAALSSSVWLVCKKRSPLSRPGWDNKVLEDMKQKITTRLRDFWDAGIRGPDFVWAATGPALEAYSQYPVVKKADEPGQVMAVGEFLGHVRRMVVDFVVGRVLSAEGQAEISGLDSVTTYYLLHRNDFGLGEAPAGPCILYAVSCGLSDKELADRYDLLSRQGGKSEPAGDAESDDSEETDGEEGEDGGSEEGSGSAFRLKTWNVRRRSGMGYAPGEEPEGTRPHGARSPSQAVMDLGASKQAGPVYVHEIPLIDQVHRLMHLWKAGEVREVDEYLDQRGLHHNPLFHPLLQALIELAPTRSEERSLLESISNHVGGHKQAMERML